MGEVVIMIVLLGISPSAMRHQKMDVIKMEVERVEQGDIRVQDPYQRIDESFLLRREKF